VGHLQLEAFIRTAWIFLAVSIGLFALLAALVAFGPLFEHPWIAAPMAAQIAADALFKMAIASFSLQNLFAALQEWQVATSWSKLGKVVTGVATVTCSLAFVSLLSTFHFDAKP